MITKSKGFGNASEICFASHFRLWRDVCFTRGKAVKAGGNDCIYEVSGTYRLSLPLDNPRCVLSKLAKLFVRWNDSLVHSVIVGDSEQ